jgi:heme exporter protein A
VPHAPAELVRATGLVKRFGDRIAVNRVGLAVAGGECLAVLGPNGAGKSTLLRMIATLLRPEGGEVEVCGHPLPARANRARAEIGYLGHDPMVYLDLTARQNLELYADLFGLDDARDRVDRGLDRVGLLARSFDPVRTFSRGMAQRLGLARALLHEPRVLLLDEPYSGLDAAGARLLDAVLGDLGADRAAIIVTHEVEPEREQRVLDGILGAPVPRDVLLVAKAGAIYAYLLAVEVVAVPVMALFFIRNPDPVDLLLIGVVCLIANVGIAVLGSLLAVLALFARARELLLPVLFLHSLLPVVIAAAGATHAVAAGTNDLAEYRGYCLFLAVYAVIFGLVAYATYEHVFDD